MSGYKVESEFWFLFPGRGTPWPHRTTATRSARPPRQARSRATLDRLLDATAAVLAEKPFDEASIAEIVHRAGTSVGAFYGRFSNKDSLLDCFDERFFDLGRASCDEFFDSDSGAGRHWKTASPSLSRCWCVTIVGTAAPSERAGAACASNRNPDS